MGSSQSSPQKKMQNNDHQTVDEKIIVVPADMVVLEPADVVAVALVGWSLIKLMALVRGGLTKLVSSSSGSRSDEKIMKISGCGKLETNSTDGSVTNSQEGFGAVIRNESGFCIICFYGRVRDDCLIMEPELRATYEGLKIIQGSDPAGLEEESDSTHGHGSHEMMEANDGRLIRWRFPACGKLKMNTDGSVINSKDGFGGRAGFGGVIRDERGFCIMCFYGKLRDDCSILGAELWAIYKGLKIIQGRDLREVEIESDSKAAISLIKNVKNDNMKAIRTMLSSTGCTLKHTLREGNRVADKLAKLGREGDSNFKSFATPPKEIRSLLDADVANAGFVRGAR